MGNTYIIYDVCQWCSEEYDKEQYLIMKSLKDKYGLNWNANGAWKEHDILIKELKLKYSQWCYYWEADQYDDYICKNCLLNIIKEIDDKCQTTV